MTVQGDCDPRFRAVREEFERNFAERGEVGGARALLLGGLGGHAHHHRGDVVVAATGVGERHQGLRRFGDVVGRQDLRQIVFPQRLQHQLDPDEQQDHTEAFGQINQPLQQVFQGAGAGRLLAASLVDVAVTVKG